MIEHFRLVPTDPRYKELTDEQIEILFQSFLLLADDEAYREHYHEQARAKAMKAALPVEELEEGGYSAVEIEQIMKDIGAPQ